MEHFLMGKHKNDSVLYITGETLAINTSDSNNIQCVKSKTARSAITQLIYCTAYDQGQ